MKHIWKTTHEQWKNAKFKWLEIGVKVPVLFKRTVSNTNFVSSVSNADILSTTSLADALSTRSSPSVR